MIVYVFEKIAFINETNGVRIDGQNQAIAGIEHYCYKSVKNVAKDDVHETWNITLADDSVVMHSQANYNLTVMTI